MDKKFINKVLLAKLCALLITIAAITLIYGRFKSIENKNNHYIENLQDMQQQITIQGATITQLASQSAARSAYSALDAPNGSFTHTTPLKGGVK